MPDTSRRLLAATASVLLATPLVALASVPSAAAAPGVNEPPSSPVSIIAFPSRDFVSSSGFLAQDLVDVSVIRNGQVVATAPNQVPQDDPATSAFDGLVEVNHPGGGCWNGIVPELRPGDVVRTVAHDASGVVRTTDQTRTANVTAARPVIVTPASSATSRDGVIQIHGTAMSPDGSPLPADQIEERLIANRDAFDLSGSRTLRAGGAGTNGTLTYDTANNPTGVNWTATYRGLSSDDVYRAAGGTSLSGTTFAGAESRILWLGINPLTLQGQTVYENGAGVTGGAAAGACTGTLESPDGSAPTTPVLSAPVQSAPTDQTLSWSASTDDTYVAGYRIFRDGQPISNVGGTYATPGDSTSAFSVPTSFTDHNVPPGSHTYSVAAFDNASAQSSLSDPDPVVRLAAGLGQPFGNQSPQSGPVSVTQADVTAPSAPTGLVAVVPNGQDATLTWQAATDNVGVTGYEIFRNNVKIGTTNGTTLTYTDKALAPGSYTYTVDAVDAAGNRSAASATATANAFPDTVPPSDVTGLGAVNSPDVHSKDVKISWTAATDTVGVTGYGIYRDGVKIADVNQTTLSYTDLGRPAGTYAYTVDAVDSAGNRSVNKPTPVSVVVANDPPAAPHDLIAFPARDFISATGYTPGTSYTFSVIRGGKAVFTSTPVVADSTGLAEVNHPGGACWNTTTPNIVPGDVVRITDPTGVAEQTTVAGVTDERPIVTAVDSVTGGGTVVVHGTAQDGLGNPLPIDQIEQRLIANRDAFDLSGRRTVRAGAGLDGTMTYDAAGSTHWTATYTFQTPNDLARAVGGTSTSGTSFAGAESRVLWLGRNPLSPVESTIFENGPGVTGGPGAGITGCTSGPAETPAPGAALSAAPTFATTAVNSTSASQTVTLTNNGTGPLHVDHAYLAGLNTGDFTLNAAGANGATVPAGASVTVSVAFRPVAAGQRQANVSFVDDAANTTDQTVTLVGSTPVAATPTVTAPVQSLAAGSSVGVASPVANSTLPVDLRWSGTGTRYELQMATGNGPSTLGAFTPVPLTPDSATSTTVNLKMGSSTGTGYQFQVRSCTGTTCSAWAQGPKFTLQPADDSGMAASQFKGTWTSATLAGAYGGTVKWAAGSANATIVPAVSFTVSGNAAWISTLGPDRGLAQVQVDGGAAQVVDLYSPTVQTARVVWSRDALPVGTHTITVTALGKKSTLNPNACTTGTKCAQVDIDGASIIK